MPSPSEYFRYAQQYARLAPDDKYQEHREVLIQMAAQLTQLGRLEFEMAEGFSWSDARAHVAVNELIGVHGYPWYRRMPR